MASTPPPFTGAEYMATPPSPKHGPTEEEDFVIRQKRPTPETQPAYNTRSASRRKSKGRVLFPSDAVKARNLFSTPAASDHRPQTHSQVSDEKSQNKSHTEGIMYMFRGKRVFRRFKPDDAERDLKPRRLFDTKKSTDFTSLKDISQPASTTSTTRMTTLSDQEEAETDIENESP
ncbi:hypothetical protein CANCADRAFT_129890 [Tortispora caseinolytica NRRL Y-17796]|uniref:Uncharacterized protein n=1 Tax=Tortispora caseinolytica NRRL Y-17796 TaxID=767744 RepID=A0A1E4TAP0_9ASCO|nr:hypothetical protein CANCADRAFT_129890 [Tortispora caseinolytica NRRL Y-17796]